MLELGKRIHRTTSLQVSDRTRFPFSERRCRSALALPRSPAAFKRRAVARDFKQHARSMAENEWSVALAAVMKALAKAGVNQMIVTRERTVYGWPIASMIKVASALSRPRETNNT